MISLFKQVIQAVNNLSDEKNAAHKRFVIKTAKESGKPFIQACFHVLWVSILGQVAKMLVAFLGSLIVYPILDALFFKQTDHAYLIFSALSYYFVLGCIPDVFCTLCQVLSLTVDDLES